jgi:dTDP-4-amino-4,6-dideoxygalactose transaminase
MFATKGGESLVIPFLDLQAQYHSIKDDLQGAINTVLASGRFVLGEEVAAFEQEFAEYCQAQYAVGVNSGTSALHLALLVAGVGPGDEVITVAFTFVATLAAILFTGAQPVLVDIDPVSYCMDASQLEASINPNTKAIVPVHLYGQPADMEPILQIARQHGLVVIEDAAQAHGAVYQGCRVGGIGDLACFSFYPAKNLGAFGEAGIVVTSDPNYAQKVRMLRDWGQAQKHHHRLRGFNYRMDAIQGAVLRVKLRHLDRWNAARSSVASRYDSLLADADLHLPSSLPDRQHVYHIYAVRSPERDR